MSHWNTGNLAPMSKVKPANPELKVHKFEEGWEHPEWGKVQFANDNFVTMLTPNPPGAHRCNDMWNCGWEIYVQPQKIWNGPDGKKHVLTTYKRRDI